jgi:hypothetical protein
MCKYLCIKRGNRDGGVFGSCNLSCVHANQKQSLYSCLKFSYSLIPPIKNGKHQSFLSECILHSSENPNMCPETAKDSMMFHCSLGFCSPPSPLYTRKIIPVCHFPNRKFYQLWAISIYLQTRQNSCLWYPWGNSIFGYISAIQFHSEFIEGHPCASTALSSGEKKHELVPDISWKTLTHQCPVHMWETVLEVCMKSLGKRAINFS